MIPDYLLNLHLPQVFSAYSNDVGRYIRESTKDEHIVDSEFKKISVFVTTDFGVVEDTAQNFFSVKNPLRRPYALLQIDNGIIKSSAIKKCDCAIANDNHFCFIEFKADAISDKTLTIHKTYTKAIEQLSTTIALFDSYYSPMGHKISDLRITEAHICFRQGYPRNTSTQMNYQVSFASSNKGIPLLFTREKVL